MITKNSPATGLAFIDRYRPCYRASALCLLASALLACGGGGGGSNAAAPVAQPADTPSADAPPSAEVTPNPMHGYFAGNTEIEGAAYYSEALVTEDGLIRMYVSYLDGAVQVSGNLMTFGEGLAGTGQVMGETCSADDSRIYCNEWADAERLS